MEIKHVVVLMLENRSFDCILGKLYPSGPKFDGLTGEESNPWHQPDGSTENIPVWNDPTLTAQSLCIPDPDPGELFIYMQMQLYGLNPDGTPHLGAPSMDGFVDNYMRQPAADRPFHPGSVMHYFTPDQVPVISQLARAFGVSDRWHASAPCQTWPNRFFAHTGTAEGYVNNEPTHFPYLMETVFNRLNDVGQSWHIYFHDMPQSSALARLWEYPFHFKYFDTDFARDAALGNLPAYSFIEPRYFADVLLNKVPDDEHPPHNVAYGEELIAAVYNAVRGGPGWKDTLLLITYDEHGGCYDHVAPPGATPPGGNTPDGFNFDTFGVRVPAVIVSPYVPKGSIIRASGATPFDHTSIIATLRKLFGIASLTPRDAAAPDLLSELDGSQFNDGPASITAPAVPPTPAQVAALASKPPNDLQKSLSTAAMMLPAAGAHIGAHINQLMSAVTAPKLHSTVAAAAGDVAAGVKAFLGKN
jgi:phospholipase C